jgi:hypothetical protein
MLRPEEQNYLFEHAARRYLGEGAVVDLGCWLGGGTAPLAEGLENNRRDRARGRVVDAFDSFDWSPWMAQTYRGTALETLETGSSFLLEFERNVSAWKHRIRVHAGDLTETRWTGGAIELLFVDAMKSWDLANAIVSSFYPALRPRLSIVVHQDFVHWNTPWILLLSYRFRDWLAPEHWIAPTSSYVFRCVAEPPPDALRARFDFETFSEEEADRAFAYCRALLPRAHQANIVAAQLTYQIYRGRLEAAKAGISRALERGCAPESELRHVGPRLRQVEALRRLLQGPGPLEPLEISKRGFLDADEATLALSELAALGLAAREHGGEGGYTATARGSAWIDRSFDKAALGLS